MWWFMSVIAYLMGSIPFSLILVRWRLGVDVRDYGDGNPGATNAFRAAGLRLGLAGGLLDFLKGAVPVGLAAQFLDIGGFRLAAVATSALLGSAFSPWLDLRGGKSIACTFGVWTGILMFEAPLVMGLSLSFWVTFLRTDAWSAVLGYCLFLVYLILRGTSLPLLALGAINGILLVFRHREDLSGGPRPRPWLARLWRLG